MNSFNTLVGFHFLRPELLTLLLLLPILILLLRKGATRDNSWSQHINPTLLEAMQGSQSPQAKKRARTWLLASSLALLVLATAGPSWVEKPQPATKRSDNMVVILDLSLSMLSEDSPPSRLVRAKQKIVDLIAMRNEGNTALVAFSGDSFVVTPLTDDMRTVESNLSALEPLIMPVIGSRPDLAVTQAKELLFKAGAPQGRIVLITDGVATHQLSKIEDTLRGSRIKLDVIGVGTEEGGPIKLPENRGYLKDSGTVVIAKTDLRSLKELALSNRGVFAELALDDSDLEAIDASGAMLLLDAQESKTDSRFDQWEDMGYVFLALALPLFLLCYRQGGLLIVAILLTPQQSEAFQLIDLWQTKDQQAQALLEEGSYEAAAQLFESTRHRADALYRSGEYEQAAKLYAQFEDADSLYNLGNALARGQKLSEAIDAYARALKLDPNHHQALENKILVESLLEQQQQASNQSGEQSEDQNAENSSSQQQQDSQSQADANSSEQPSSEQPAGGEQPNDQSQLDQTDNEPSQQAPKSAEDIEELNKRANQSQSDSNESESDAEQREQDGESALTAEQLRALEEQAPGDETANQSMAIEESLSTEEQRSYEQWMRRVPDDPSGLLRRKFEQQARERKRENNPEEPLW